jgi:hypothetical protein
MPHHHARPQHHEAVHDGREQEQQAVGSDVSVDGSDVSQVRPRQRARPDGQQDDPTEHHPLNKVKQPSLNRHEPLRFGSVGRRSGDGGSGLGAPVVRITGVVAKWSRTHWITLANSGRP